MKKFALLATALLCGCNSTSFLKVDSDGYYRFKEHPIAVKDPFPADGDFSVIDTSMSVDFVLGAGYWMFAGDYAVQVFNLTPEISNRDGFTRYCQTGPVGRFIEGDRKAAGFNFRALKTEFSEVNGRPAMRGVGVDRSAKIPALFLVTAVLFDTRLVYASAIFKLKDESDEELTDLEKHSGFNRWVAMIEENRPAEGSSSPVRKGATTR
jgi:hypothetical protein